MFKKGVSGNPKGRPKGSVNKVRSRVAEAISALLENNLEKFQENFDELEPKERIRILLKLLEFVLPKAQADYEDDSNEGGDSICELLVRLARENDDDID